MSKIDEFNDAVKGVNVLGITFTNKQQLQLRKMLDAIIIEEILPSISEKTALLMAKINIPLTLVIEGQRTGAVGGTASHTPSLAILHG